MHDLLGTHSTGRSLLQRRNNLTTPLQALLDGAAIIFLVVTMSIAITGKFTMPYMVFALCLLGSMSVIYDRMNIYRHHGTMTKKAFKLLKAWSSVFAFLVVLAFLSKNSELYSRTVAISVFLFGYLSQVSLHFLFRYFQRRSAASDINAKALIIGTGSLADHIFERINKNPWMPEEVLGTVTVSEFSVGKDELAAGKPPIIGTLKNIRELITNNDIQTIYVAVNLDASPVIQEIYFDLLDLNVNIHWAPNIFALNLINHSVKELAGIPILTLSETPLIGSHLFLKTIEDRVLAFLILILACPIMLATAIAIKWESRGPIFFRQERTGWDGENFKIWKFRSMSLHDDEDGKIKQATQNDTRITRVGQFIRRTSIDELPQLFNVLAGEMSLVGPRPHALQHNEEYSSQIVAYMARHRIKPGMTGLAQIRGCRGETKELEQMEKRVKYDLEYINSWSLWLDLSILIRTPFTLKSDKAY
ncbi:MAG: undecaprenyl-phosphate glucose phosphotransferase [Candidatus Thiodiazotropha sp. LLP2]